MNKHNEELNREVRREQVRPVAGIWACDNCGRRIQVIMESTVPMKQPFVCVCGTDMRPGEEHVTPAEDMSSVADQMEAVDKTGPLRDMNAPRPASR